MKMKVFWIQFFSVVKQIEMKLMTMIEIHNTMTHSEL
jgi:hypothetical protein